MSEKSKARLIVDELIKTIPCCSCCDGNKDYVDLVVRAAALADIKVTCERLTEKVNGFFLGFRLEVSEDLS